ncbi:MAG: NADH-quinone oxidoreductase subunit NuoK [Verrucomicrobiota bacterium]
MAYFTDITLNHYVALSGMLFMLGLVAVITRKNSIIILMGLAMMLNAANLALVAFARFHPEGALNAHMMVFFIITVAAAEVAVGLALIVALFRKRQTVDVTQLTELKF